MQRCLQLHEQHGPSHPRHSSHQYPPAPRSTNRSTAAPASRPCGLRNVTVTAGGWPGRRTQLALLRLPLPRRRCHGTFPITTTTNSTPDRPHPADAVAEASRRAAAPRKADRQTRSARLTLTQPTHIPRADNQRRRHRQHGRAVGVTGIHPLIAAMTGDRTWLVCL